MSKWKEKLTKLGVLEPEEGVSPVVTAENVAADPVETPVVSAEDAMTASGQSLADIYAKHNVPVVDYPVERLATMMNNMKAMPIEIQKQAIKAMDAAENRSIAEPIGDAKAKLAVLADEQAEMAKNLSGVAASNNARIEASKAAQAEDVAKIQTQITQLQELMTRSTQSGDAERAAIQKETDDAKNATNEQIKRLDDEGGKIRYVLSAFSDSSKDAII